MEEHIKFGRGSVTRAMRNRERIKERRLNNQCPSCGREIILKKFIMCSICRAGNRKSRLKRLNKIKEELNNR